MADFDGSIALLTAVGIGLLTISNREHLLVGI